MAATTISTIQESSHRRRARSTKQQSPVKSKRRNFRTRRPRRCGPTEVKAAAKSRYRRSHATLRAHRERLAKTTEDTFRTVLTTHEYDEDPITDGDDNIDFAVQSAYSRHHNLTQEIAYTSAASACYPHQSTLLANWEEGPMLSVRDILSSGPEFSVPTADFSQVASTTIEFANLSSLEAARRVWNELSQWQNNTPPIGVLNTVSPKKPGGASLSGGVTLEECLVRQTTLFDSLQNSPASAQFYAEHRASKAEGSGLHDHALLYSPGVIVFKNDRGQRIAPYDINVVSAVPVHAGTVRAKSLASASDAPALVRAAMRERMARVLRLYEERGVRTLILCAFGVGQACNSPDMIGELWAELLGSRGAKFRDRFDKVVFAVPGKHREVFERSFYATVLESELASED